MIPLYGEYFGLTSQPFSVSPDPKFFYGSPSHREGLAQLTYGIQARRGFVVLTGEVGTGKTTLIHNLLKQLDDGHTHIAFVFTLVTNPRDLLRSVCEDLGLTTFTDGPRDLHDYLALLNQFLLESYRKGDNVALIIDEAQNLSPEVLEGVRLLSNFETSQDKVLQILLVGQPELGARLNQPELRQLKQRVALRYHLSPLTLEECKEYIAKRLEIADGSASIYPVKTVETVYAYSGGTPRLINILCDNGMLTAYALGKKSVEVGMIQEIAHDLNLKIAPKKVAAPSVDTIPIKLWDAPPPAPAEENLKPAVVVEVKPPALSDVQPSFPAPALNPQAIAKEEAKPPENARPIPKEIPVLKEVPVPKARDTAKAVVSSRSFDVMMAALTEAMGPMAPLVVREQIDAMGESLQSFPKQRLGQLVEVTSREILSEGLKARYRNLMSEEIRAIHVGKEEP
jgi:general secretion pathway protein A